MWLDTDCTRMDWPLKNVDCKNTWGTWFGLHVRDRYWREKRSVPRCRRLYASIQYCMICFCTVTWGANKNAHLYMTIHRRSILQSWFLLLFFLRLSWPLFSPDYRLTRNFRHNKINILWHECYKDYDGLNEHTLEQC